MLEGLTRHLQTRIHETGWRCRLQSERHESDFRLKAGEFIIFVNETLINTLFSSYTGSGMINVICGLLIFTFFLKDCLIFIEVFDRLSSRASRSI